MAFFYNQGNIADRKDSLSEKPNLTDYSRATYTDSQADHRHRRQPDDQTHGLAGNAHTTTNSSGRRRERLGETLRMARQGVSRREATRLAKIFGEPSSTDSPDHASPTVVRHSGGRRRGGDRQVSAAEIIESHLEPKELLLNSAGRISYGTWRGLIMYLTSNHQKTDDFVDKFMLSFRSFATPKDLADALVARARNVAHADARLSPSDLKLWHDRLQAPIQYNVFHIIRLWYNSFWYPAADTALLNYLCAFLLNEYLPSRHGSSAKECQKLLRQISLKTRTIDLRSLAASPGTSLIPPGLSKSRMPKSPVVEHLNIFGPASISSNQESTQSKHHHHHHHHHHNGTPIRSAVVRHQTSTTKGMGVNIEPLGSSESEDILRTDTNDESARRPPHRFHIDGANPEQAGTIDDGITHELTQASAPKRKNLLRRLFSKQRNNRDSSQYSSRSKVGTTANNTDDDSAATSAPTRDDSVNSGAYIEEHSRLPPPSVRATGVGGGGGGGGGAAAGRLSPARERMLAEINSHIDVDGEDGRRPASSVSAHSCSSRSSSEGPDISDLLMATVGMDLSYEAYRQISHITHVNPLDVACQLTIIESSCYCMIQPAELINKEFSRGCESSSVNVRQMTRWCTQITRWVSTLILSETTPERRCRMIKYAIQLGTHLLALKNYDGVMAIKAAIFSAAVMRLKRSWSLLPKKFDIMSKRLHEAMDSERNFANYRAMLHRSQPPLLPFLGLYLTDFTFLDDGNPTYRRFVLPHEIPQLQKHLSHQLAQDSPAKYGDDDYYRQDDKQESERVRLSSIKNNSDPVSKQNDTETHTSTTQQQQQQQAPPAVQLTGQTCALFAKRDEVDLNSRSILINFEKSYRVATIMQEFQKFQVEYSGNFTMAIPGLQQYLIEQWDRCEAEGYDDDKIYNMSLQCEPRARCSMSSSNVADGGATSSNRASHHQPVQTAMRLTRLIPGAAQRLRGRDISDTTLPSL
ncbi:hypothetical protein LPJ59_000022 [Coemansia sp. RSA 2399]|nr:hypothetical protein LPJ59_000022 [Coemansia sp. RSA 2399]